MGFDGMNRKMTDEEYIRLMREAGTPVDEETTKAMYDANKKGRKGGFSNIEFSLDAVKARDKLNREAAVNEQLSLRMSGSELPGPGQVLIGPNIGAMLSRENARRRALAMTAEEMAQLMQTGQTKVAAWHPEGAEGVGKDEKQAGGTPRGFNQSRAKDVAGVAKPTPASPSSEPAPPRDTGAGRRINTEGPNPYMPDDNQWQKNMTDAVAERERLANLPPPPVYTRPSEQEQRAREERGIAPVDPDELRRRKLKQGFRF